MQDHQTGQYRPTPRRPLALGVLLSLLLLAPAGCGGGGSNGGGSTSPSPAPAVPLSASAVTPGGLTATLAEDRSTVSTGGSVTYTLTLTNNTAQAITYEGSSTSSATIQVGGFLRVVNSSDRTVFPSPSTGPGNTLGPLTSLPITLAPGQSASGAITANGVFTVPGTYTATATFTLLPGAPSATGTAVGPLTVTVQ